MQIPSSKIVFLGEIQQTDIPPSELVLHMGVLEDGIPRELGGDWVNACIGDNKESLNH